MTSKDVSNNKSINKKIFYHGTSYENIPNINKKGITPGNGILNSGVYITENWRMAMWFGDSLYNVKLKKGTRILNVDVPYDKSVIDYLVREFGKDLLKADNPCKILPKNKHLTNKEIVNLVRYFFNKSRVRSTKWDKQIKNKIVKMDNALRTYYRGALIRNGYHGYGHPTNDIGYVIFNPSRITAELKIQIPQRLYMSHIDTDFKKFKNLEDLMKKIEEFKKSTNPCKHQ